MPKTRRTDYITNQLACGIKSCERKTNRRIVAIRAVSKTGGALVSFPGPSFLDSVSRNPTITDSYEYKLSSRYFVNIPNGVSYLVTVTKSLCTRTHTLAHTHIPPTHPHTLARSLAYVTSAYTPFFIEFKFNRRICQTFRVGGERTEYYRLKTINAVDERK